MFNPFDWYWLARDGRVYESRRDKIIARDDHAFTAWEDAGNVPTAWPRDDAGAQTNAALVAVVSLYGKHGPVSE